MAVNSRARAGDPLPETSADSLDAVSSSAEVARRRVGVYDRTNRRSMADAATWPHLDSDHALVTGMGGRPPAWPRLVLGAPGHRSTSAHILVRRTSAQRHAGKTGSRRFRAPQPNAMTGVGTDPKLHRHRNGVSRHARGHGSRQGLAPLPMMCRTPRPSSVVRWSRPAYLPARRLIK